MKRALLLCATLIAVSGCDSRRHAGSVVASVISAPAEPGDAARGPRSEASRLLTDATAQGLVRFDASGQIEPGLAERWIVTEDGMSYIFRLREAQWSDGKPVTSEEVVAILRRQLASHSHNPLLPYLSAIDEIVERTPEVIEVSLKRPRPDLLKLFAQPELAVFRANPPGGSGPMRAAAGNGRWTLTSVVDPDAVDEDDPVKPRPEDHVVLLAEPAAHAILRFAAHDSDLVLGGTFADWPLLSYADVAPANIRTDPAAGLFGLAIVNRAGFLANVANRTAVAEAIDRDLLVSTIMPNWRATLQIAPEQLDSATVPTMPAWAVPPLDQRIAAASAQVQTWQKANSSPMTLRIALPPGPGANLLYGQIGVALLRIGITPQRVGIGDDADLRLIDRVAPYDSARWYLVNACQPCASDVAAAIAAARDAPDMPSRAQAIATADKALTADVAFIPIARPLRWSLVALRLDAFQGNSRAWHPLNRLRNDTR